jgi:hypothetical protein
MSSTSSDQWEAWGLVRRMAATEFRRSLAAHWTTRAIPHRAPGVRRPRAIQVLEGGRV